jgi:toxin ParE1/3/4
VTRRLFAPRARRELLEAVAWIAEQNPAAAEGLLAAASRAATMVTAKPNLARVRLTLAPARFRFWSLRGYPYLLVIDTGHDPPVIARVVHQARDLPVVLGDLEQA